MNRKPPRWCRIAGTLLITGVVALGCGGGGRDPGFERVDLPAVSLELVQGKVEQSRDANSGTFTTRSPKLPTQTLVWGSAEVSPEELAARYYAFTKTELDADPVMPRVPATPTLVVHEVAGGDAVSYHIHERLYEDSVTAWTCPPYTVALMTHAPSEVARLHARSLASVRCTAPPEDGGTPDP